MLIRTLTLTVAALLPLAASAAEGSLPVSEAAQDALVVVRDAETGKLRAATNEERASLQSLRAAKRSVALSAVAATPQVKRHPNGATGVRLTDDMTSYSVMVRRPDGKLEELCFATKEEADAAVTKGVFTKSELPTK
ncbi:hypothetical protein SAMN05216359_1198 [Roseateles sp. YR242]|uniref:post-PEP-CTERM-1 domain-containing protein n=1 Tax=Roseateles sp. YR242 TaxID=1855305 RepID=UPI0008D78752|nr:hypothetical protein [Roseateles sp. YR242]SEL83797.1 hypothetical protein SAMN05216359_1198 [Roseateles sp. YR242]